MYPNEVARPPVLHEVTWRQFSHVTSPPDSPARFLEFASQALSRVSMCSRQGASSRLEAGRREGKNTEDCLPTCPPSLLERRSVVSRPHPAQDHSGASPRCSCKRHRKERLVQISQRGITVSPQTPTGRPQTVEEAETRFRAVDEIWKPLEELVKFWSLHSASSIVVLGANYRTFVLFRECVRVYGVKPPDTQKFR